MHVIARKDAHVATLHDLAGKRVSLSGKQSGTRALVEDEELVLEEIVARIPPGHPDELSLRVVAADRFANRGQYERALEVLGPMPAGNADCYRNSARMRMAKDGEVDRRGGFLCLRN